MSGNESKSIIAIVVCVLFYLAYSQYLSTKYPEYGKQRQASTSSEQITQEDPAAPGSASSSSSSNSSSMSGSTAAAAESEVIPQLEAQQLTLESDTSIYRFDQETASLVSVVLKNYSSTQKTEAPAVDLLESQMFIQGRLSATVNQPAVKGFHAERDGRRLIFWRTDGIWKITQTYEIPESGYGAKLDVAFENTSPTSQALTAAVTQRETINYNQESNMLGFIPGAPTERSSLVYYATGSLNREDLESFCEEGAEATIQYASEAVKFYGVDTHYFLKTMLPTIQPLGIQVQPLQHSKESCELAMVSYVNAGNVAARDTFHMSYDLFFGPKDVEILRNYESSLTDTIDLGFFGFIARPLLAIIHGFYGVLPNYGLAIILLTVLLKVLFYPLMKASSVSMHKMKKLNPQMQTIREKFKDDRARQQQELMKFMAQHKINPMKGCLPILPQIPVFFAFYQVLRTGIELRHAPFFGWIHDLSSMDPYFVTPLLMGVAMFIQQRLTPTTGMDKTQERILMFMPIMFTLMMLTLPAGMTLYMLTNTVVGILQQRWLYKKLDQAEA